MKRLELITELQSLKAAAAGLEAASVGLQERIGSIVAALEQQAAPPDDFVAEPLETFREPPPPPRDPVAKNISDLVTPKQLGMIRALGREKGVDFQYECQQLHGCKAEDLSKRAASILIEHLQKLQPEFTAKRA